MLVQNVKVQLVRPPVPVGGAAAGYLSAHFACYRALAVCAHLRSPLGVKVAKLIKGLLGLAAFFRGRRPRASRFLRGGHVLVARRGAEIIDENFFVRHLLPPVCVG
jgi:hypothetical protein